MKTVCTLLFSAFCLFAPGVRALAPHEVVVLVNVHSPESIEVANYYVAMRRIPASHVIYLDVPEYATKLPYRIELADFMKHIFVPAAAAIQERRIGHILAWIYSVDFPVKVRTGRTDDLSIHGATFVRGRVPDAETVKTGQYVSPLYGGPEPESGQLSGARTFDRSMADPAREHPVPSMSLGFTGTRGNTLDTVLSCLRAGVQADATRPRGTVYFVKSEDVRSTCRHWQFEPTQRILRGLGITAEILDEVPRKQPAVLGLMDGRTYVKPMEVGTFLPGAMAEHLTSLSAVFEDFNQSKCTEWIHAGATASAGAVTEPYAIWTKFPASTFFSFYAQGCSMIESFYQSVRCPLQLYMIGEPLASPWRRPFSLTVVSLDDDPLSGSAEFFAQAFPAAPPGAGLRYRVLLNDRPLFHQPAQSSVKLDTRRLPDGYNRLRVIGEFGADVTFSAFGERGFVVDNHGRSVVLAGVTNRAVARLDETLKIEVQAAGTPTGVGLLAGARHLALDKPDGERHTFDLAVSALGAGPVELQAFADYADGMRVLSGPIRLNVEKGATGQPPD